MIPIMAIGAIVSAAVSAGTAIGGAVAASGPTSASTYRKQRMKELGGTQGLASTGLTAAQEDELRVLGMDKYHQVQGQLTSQRADELANVPGGATGRDTVLAADRDSRILHDTAQQIERQISAEDQRVKDSARAELGALAEKHGAEQRRSRESAVQQVTAGAQDIASIATSAGAQNMTLNSPYAQKLQSAGLGDSEIADFYKMPPDQQKELLSMLGITN